jgi:hypothetical protein
MTEIIDDIFWCENKDRCKWKCFATDHDGFGIGRIENTLPLWREWHEKICGGKLIQGRIIKCE